MEKKRALTLVINAVLAGGLLLGAAGASAHEKGDIIVRAGAVHLANDRDDNQDYSVNGTDIPNSNVEVSHNTQLGLTISYMLTDHIGVELLAATPFAHDIKVDVSTIDPSVGKVNGGSTKHLPPTLSLQYFPMDSASKFQPYIGVGVNYTFFFEEHVDSDLDEFLGLSGGGLEIDSNWGFAGQIGIDYQITDKWLVNAAVWHIDLETDGKFTFDGGTEVKTVEDLDPWVFMFSLGYKF